MSLIDDAIKEVNEEDRKKQPLLSEEEIVQKRKEWCKKRWYKTAPLPRLIDNFLDKYDLDSLYKIIDNVVVYKAERQYKKPPTISGNIPANWLQSDPVLQYVLKHEIPDRLKRSSVLFKNLAVGLVKSGLSDGEIREYAQKIVANCPGKNINEFLGWVKRIRGDLDRGIAWSYNYAEIDRWIKDVKSYER